MAPSAEETAAKLVATELAQLRGAIADLVEHARVAVDEIRQARADFAKIGTARPAPYNANEWWRATSLIQELEHIANKLRPIVRERGDI